MQALNSKVSLDEIRKNIIDEMEKGKQSLQIIRTISLQRPRFKLEDAHQDSDLEFYRALDHHSMVALSSYVASISMLRSCDFVPAGLIRKRKIDQLDDEIDSLDGDVKFEGSSMEVPKDTIGGRGRYKRSRNGEARVEEVTQLSDDGFAWRKYGQKTIHNASHPRNYYRCTHKHDQKCQATKQVQQISETPTKYMIIYHGNHTCNHTLKSNPIIIDPPEEHTSAMILSFDQSNLNNNLNLFPASTYPAMKQEHECIKQELPSVSYDCYSSGQNHQFSPSSENVSSSQDVTAITGISSTPVSEQSDVLSTAENFSRQDDVEEDYSCIWADLELSHDLYAY